MSSRFVSRQLILCCLAALASFALACDDATVGTTTPAPPPETPSPAETALPVRLSGIPAVDRIVGMVAARDGAGLAAALVVHRVPCNERKLGKPDVPPICETGEPEGTLQDSVIFAPCQGGWTRAEDGRAAMVRFAAWPLALYAAAEDLRTPARYLLVFTDPSFEKTLLVLNVSAAGIEDAGIGCGNPPPEQVAPNYLRFVIPPPP